MSKNTMTTESCIYEFLRKEFFNSKDYTRDKCRWSLERTKRSLEAAGFETHPRDITADAIQYLMDEVWSKHAVSYMKSECSYLKRFLRFYNNDVIDRMKIVFPQDMRVNVDWLEEEQYDALMNCPKTPFQDIIIHLELCMGFRSVECIRLMLDDIHSGGSKPYMNVRGKGRGNGKYRSVRFHYQTKDALARWMVERNRMVALAKANDPSWEDPGTLILYQLYKNKPIVDAYGEHTGAVDERVLNPLRAQLGFDFANHTLRRTFGRRLFHAGVPIETISKFLGHESTTETLGYIGVNLDDMDAGMAMLAQYDTKKLYRGGPK